MPSRPAHRARRGSENLALRARVGRRGRARRACTARRTTARRSSSPSTRSTRPATRSGTSTGRRTASSTGTTSSASRRRPSCARYLSLDCSALDGLPRRRRVEARVRAHAARRRSRTSDPAAGSSRAWSRSASELRDYLPPRARSTHLHDLLTALDGDRRRRRRDRPARARVAYAVGGGAAARSLVVLVLAICSTPRHERARTSCAGCARSKHDVVGVPPARPRRADAAVRGHRPSSSRWRTSGKLLADPRRRAQGVPGRARSLRRRLSAVAARGRRRVPPRRHRARRRPTCSFAF